MDLTLSLMEALMKLILAITLAASTICAAADLRTNCDSCHGADGNAVQPSYPKLAALDPDYVSTKLQRCDALHLSSASLPPKVARTVLSRADIDLLARAYAHYPRSRPEDVDAGQVELGKMVYDRESSSRIGLACEDCHSDDGSGINSTARFHAIPAIARQNVPYLVNALKHYRSLDVKKVTGHTRTMARIAGNLNDDEIMAVANYIAGM